MTRRRKGKPNGPSPQPAPQEPHPHFLKAVWRRGKWALPLAAAGILAYTLVARNPSKPAKREGPVPEHGLPRGQLLIEETKDRPAARVVFNTPATGFVCAKCHDLDKLAEGEEKRFLQAAREAQEIYPPSFRLSKDRLIFYPVDFSRFGALNAIAAFKPNKQTIEVNLGKYAGHETKEDVLRHELVHYFTTQPDHLLDEPWAHVAGLLHDPSSFRREVTEENRPLLANRFTAAFLGRAAVLAGKVPQPIEATRSTLRTDEVVRQYQEQLETPDIEKAAALWKEAWKEYDRNDVFWDVLAQSNGHDPHIVVDVALARKLFERKDPAFLKAYADPTALKGVSDFLTQRRARVQSTPARLQVNDLRPPFGDPREHYQLVTKTAEPALDSRAINARYYAALHHLYCTPANEVNYAAVPAAVLRTAAQDKKAMVEKVARELDGEEASLRATGQADLVEGVRYRKETYLKRAKELERAVREGNYLGVHER